MKLKEELIGLGITEELAERIASEIIDGKFIPKARFNELNEENKALKTSVSERDKQLDELKKSNGDHEELKTRIETLQAQNAEQKKAFEAEMKKFKLDSAIESALSASGARNNKALKALLDITKANIDNDGKLCGIEEQIEAIRKTDGYLFEKKDSVPELKGFQPGASSDLKPDAGIDPNQMTYSQMAAYMEANPGAKLN